MIVYNIVKIQASGNTITNTPVGYLMDIDDKTTFESIHGTPLVDWANNNPGVDLVTYFDTNEPCYLIDTVSYIKEGLSLITNLENPEA